MTQLPDPPDNSNSCRKYVHTGGLLIAKHFAVGTDYLPLKSIFFAQKNGLELRPISRGHFFIDQEVLK